MSLDVLVHEERVNAIVVWVSTTVVVLGAVESFLTNEWLWGGFILLVAIVIALPAVSTRTWTALVPWPLPACAALAVLLRASGLYLEIAGYVAITAVALVAVVELDVFTPVELSRRFAIVFAVMTTMAVQALWTIAQFYSDRWWGSEYLRTQTELQWDFVFVTVVGLVLGVLSEVYFDRFEPVGSFKRPPTR